MTVFTAREKYREAMRELAYRRHVYVRLIASRRMSETDARRRIELMEAIAADYQAIAEKEDDERGGQLPLEEGKTT